MVRFPTSHKNVNFQCRIKLKRSKPQDMVIQLSSHWWHSTTNRKRNSMTTVVPLVKACASLTSCTHLFNIKIHMCGEKKENALFDWKDDSEGEKKKRKIKDEKNEGYLRSNRHTQVFTYVENRYRFFYLLGVKKHAMGTKKYS